MGPKVRLGAGLKVKRLAVPFQGEATVKDAKVNNSDLVHHDSYENMMIILVYRVIIVYCIR